MAVTAGSSGYGGDWNTKGHGSARWMSPEEASELELETYRPGSIVLGQNSQSKVVFLNRPGHVLLLAPPRTGKGIGIVQSNLIAHRSSVVCIDPKAENCCVSYHFRRNVLGQQVIVLDPANKINSYQLPERIPTHRFNPLRAFDNGDYVQVVDDIAMVVDALMVQSDSAKDEQHWREGGASFLTSILTYMTFFMTPKDRHLPKLARLANGIEISHDDLFAALTHNDHADPAMRDVIARAGAWWDKMNPKERAGYVSYALRSLRWLNSPIWSEHLTDSDFDPADLKAGNTSLYIISPLEKTEQFAPWFRTVLSCCIISIIRAPKRCEIPCLFILDEQFAAVGKLAILDHSIPYIEGMGARYLMVFQYLSQLSKLWPDPEFHGKFASAGAHVFFNVSDQHTAEYVSKYMGNQSAATPAPTGMSFVQRNLLTPDEVRCMPPNDQLVFIRGYRPAWLEKLDVRKHPAFRDCLMPNPTYAVVSSKSASLLTRDQPLLSAASARERAKQSTALSLTAVTASLEKLYPGKSIRIKEDFCGYDVEWLNPGTDQVETVFTPIMHVELAAKLAQEEAL